MQFDVNKIATVPNPTEIPFVPVWTGPWTAIHRRMAIAKRPIAKPKTTPAMPVRAQARKVRYSRDDRGRDPKCRRLPHASPLRSFHPYILKKQAG
jgi:hypothetical protein